LRGHKTKRAEFSDDFDETQWKLRVTYEDFLSWRRFAQKVSEFVQNVHCYTHDKISQPMCLGMATGRVGHGYYDTRIRPAKKKSARYPPVYPPGIRLKNTREYF